MSADNWTVCPKCLQKIEAENAFAEQRVRSRYGKVTEAAYRKLIEKHEQRIDRPRAVSFREHYEIGVTKDGEFLVNYSGRCDDCGFAHNYKRVEKLFGGERLGPVDDVTRAT